MPLCTMGPDYPVEVLKPERRKALSEEDSLAVWRVHTGGGERRPRQADVEPMTLGAAVKAAGSLEKIVAGAVPPARPGLSAGWDFRSMTINQKKPGYQPRFAHYHRNEGGTVDYVRLIDKSPEGHSNLALHLKEVPDGTLFKVEYFGRDTVGRMVPGVFVHSQSARSILYLLPAVGGQIRGLRDLAAVALLDNDLRPKTLLTLKNGLPEDHYAYNYRRPDSLRYNEALDRITRIHLVPGEKCELAPVKESITLKEFTSEVKRAPCRGVKEQIPIDLKDARLPAWIEGKLLPAAAKKVTKNPASP